MGSANNSDDFDAYAFVQSQRAGRKIKRPKKINSDIDEGGLITFSNETGRPCIDDEKSLRVLLVADLRKGHPELKPGLLGRTIPRSSDYYRYVCVEFDNGITEVVSLQAVQPVLDEVASELANSVRRQIQGSRFDWDDDVAFAELRKWEIETFGPNLDLSKTLRGGDGPFEVYAYTFSSLMELAAARGEENYPVKIGYTGTASETAPSLSRIDGQLGETASRCEAATILCVWNTWNGRGLEAKVHASLRQLGRRVRSAVGREWFNTHRAELHSIIESVVIPERSGVPLGGPILDNFQGFRVPCQAFAESLRVLCARQDPSGCVVLEQVAFDDLLEEAATPAIRAARQSSYTKK